MKHNTRIFDTDVSFTEADIAIHPRLPIPPMTYSFRIDHKRLELLPPQK